MWRWAWDKVGSSAWSSTSYGAALLGVARANGHHLTQLAAVLGHMGSSFFCRPNDEARSSTTIVCALKKLQRVQDKCPVAVLVGVDATPEPGLRGPTNFAGTLNGEAVQGLNQTLTATRHASLSASDRSTALIISFAILLVIEQTHDVPFCFTTHHQR